MNRATRPDQSVGQRLTAAAFLFGGAMFTLAGVGAWVVLGSRSTSVSGGETLVVLAVFLAAVAAGVNLLVAYARLRWYYRCPQCTARVPRAPEAGPRIRYECVACAVEWDTGWSEADTD